MKTSRLRTRDRARTATALVALLTAASTVGLSGLAVADDIANQLDASVDAIAEVMPLNVG